MSWYDNLQRYGAAAAATTSPGQTPQYGLVYDLGTGLWLDADQFRNFVRDVTPITQKQTLDFAEANRVTSLRERELMLARNYQEKGFAAEDGASGWEKRTGGLGDIAQNIIGGSREGLRMIPVVGSYLDIAGIAEDDLPDDAYEQYTKRGGLLTEEEFNQFDEGTRIFLLNQAKGSSNLERAMDVPGVEPVLQGLSTAYRGMTAGALMIENEVQQNDGLLPFNLSNFLGPQWFSKDKWSEAWREAEEKSLGNALVDTILQPYTSEDQLDDWRKNNSVYQMTSFGAEFAAAWAADPGVIAGKALGQVRNIRRGELPANLKSPTRKAMIQGLQREQITVRSPLARKFADWRVERILDGHKGVEEFARGVDYPTFRAKLPMFRKRQVDGGPAAYAVWWAANNGTDEIMDLTWQMLHGDPKAYAVMEKLKRDPKDLEKFAPGSRTFIDAVEATKTKVGTLEREIEELKAAGPATLGGKPIARQDFHNWSIHTDIETKQKMLDEATSALEGYQGYGSWLELLGTQAGDKALPLIDSVYRPKAAKLNKQTERHNKGVRRFFQDNQFGFAHSVVAIPESTWIQKANTAAIHDLDSGVMSINRQFKQFEHLFGYRNPEAREQVLTAWTTAPTNMDRYKVLYEAEQTHLVQAAADHFGLSNELVREVWKRINAEDLRVKQGVMSGTGSVYSTAPSLRQRANNPDDHAISLVSESKDGKTVQIQLMNGSQHKQTLTLPKQAMDGRPDPVDITQTPNYYNPVDTRRFYYELKRNKEVLNAIDASRLTHSKAWLANLTDVVGTAFNSFWKPAVLWRFGWPQRVLMDEGMRAMAIFGPMHWLTGPGADAVVTAARNIPPYFAKRWDVRRKGEVPLGAGSVTRFQKREVNPHDRDRQITEAVQVPESQWPKINPGRLEKVKGSAAAYAVWRRKNDAINAWTDEYTKSLDAAVNLETLERAGSDILAKAESLGIEPYKITGGFAHPKPYHPLTDVYKDWRQNVHRVNVGEKPVAPGVYDPVTGRRYKKGYVVPIPDDNLAFSIGSGDRQSLKNMYFWYEQNAELLSREGMRLIVDKQGDIRPARYFPTNRRKQANDFLLQVEASSSLDTPWDVRMWDVNRDIEYQVKEANDFTPNLEAANRLFTSEQALERHPGTPPVMGKQIEPVFHGTESHLPDDLLPRDEVGVVNGNMVGKGLYTTTREDTARLAYGDGPDKVYSIRGSKSGKRYKVFDLDKPITEAQRIELDEFLRRPPVWSEPNNPHPADLIAERIANFDAADEWFTFRPDDGSVTWANLYESIAAMWPSTEYHAALHRYLETMHNAGALTHKAGNITGHPHNVYVWLHPEDLVVKPLYEKSGRYVPLVEYFSHSVNEIVLPENQIVRKGMRNPMVRELRQLARKIEQLTPKQRGPKNPLLVREKELMEALGLEHRRDLTRNMASGVIRMDDAEVVAERMWPSNPLLPDRYVQTDPDRFNKLVGEAKREDVTRTEAQQAAGELRAQEVEVESAFDDIDWDDMDFELDKVSTRIFRKMHKKYGSGFTTITSSDGEKVRVENAFEGHAGELMRGLTSSDKTIDVLSEGHGGALNLLRKNAAGHKTFHPPTNPGAMKKGSREYKQAILYFQRWADLVNDQMGNSPVWSKMSQGWDDDKIVRWLEDTPEGATIRREVMRDYQSPELWVNEHRAMFDYYLPSHKLQRLLHKGRLEPSDLRKSVHDDDLPDIFGPDVEVLDKRAGAGKALNYLADKVWKGLGTVPIDALSRHPFAKAVYDAKLRSLINSTDSKWLDDATVKRMQEQSRQFAMNQVKKTLWDLTDETNMTDALRFIAPFWGAQQEAILKWGRIVADRPETVARFFTTQRAAYQNFIVVDTEGNEVHTAARKGGLHNFLPYQPEDRVILRIPDFMRKGPLGEALATIGDVGIPVGSANTVLQGELPLFPGPGPLLTIPADKFLRAYNDTYGVENAEELWYRWLFPVGRPRSGGIKGVFEQVSPGYGKRIMSALSSEGDLSKANMHFQVGREMLAEAQRTGKKPPTEEEIAKAANWLWVLRTVAGMTMPVQTQFRPKNQYYIDLAHKYQREYGSEYWDKFVEDYGLEMAIYATSSTKGLVAPTKKGMEGWEKNQKFVAKYPDWASVIVGDSAYDDEFSWDAYVAQTDINIGPGDARTLREVKDSRERFSENAVRTGWYEFRQFQSALDAELYARGLTNIQQSDAADLLDLKRKFLADLTARNPEWRGEYDDFGNNIYERVHELSEFAFNSKFDNRPDMQGVRQYLMVREQVTSELDRYAAEEGGSRSLQAEENGALRQWFYDQVGQIVLSNPAFGEFYTRYLDSDTLEQGGGGW